MNRGQGFRSQPRKRGPWLCLYRGARKAGPTPFPAVLHGVCCTSCNFLLGVTSTPGCLALQGDVVVSQLKSHPWEAALCVLSPPASHVRKGKSGPLCSRDKNSPAVGFGWRQGAGSVARDWAALSDHSPTRDPSPPSLPPSQRFICSLSIMYLSIYITFVHSPYSFYLLINPFIHLCIHHPPILHSCFI